MSKSIQDIAREWLDKEQFMHKGLACGKRGPDHVLLSMEELCAAFYQHMLSLAPNNERQGGARLSRDYEALYELLCKGGDVVSRVWVGKRRYPATLDNFLGALYIEYHADDLFNTTRWSVRIGMRNSNEAFSEECTRLNLEWISPTQEVGVDQLMEVVKGVRIGARPGGIWIIDMTPLRSRFSKLLGK